MDFKIGDKVEIVSGNGVSELKGKEGIIRTISNTRISGAKVSYGVEFDEHFIGGHNLSGNLNNRNGRYFDRHHIKEIRKIDIFMESVGDKFKNRKVKVIQNGIVYKLVKTDGKVLYTYIPTKGISNIVGYSDKTEKLYIELFEQAIEEYNSKKR